MDRETQRMLDELQADAAALPHRLTESAVAAALTAGLLRPEATPEQAVTLYREVLSKLRDTGGL